MPESFKVEAYKQDLKNWKASLLKGIGYSDEKITQAVFLKTNIPILKQGKHLVGTVYQNQLNTNQYFEATSKTIIDFGRKKVGTMGVAGISIHPTPSGRMVVILAPTKGLTLLGVTLDFKEKTQVNPPRFEKRSVWFKW